MVIKTPVASNWDIRIRIKILVYSGVNIFKLRQGQFLEIGFRILNATTALQPGI